MDAIRFRVRHVDGKVEEVLTESAQVLVGSASHCDVRLPATQARAEHVVIESSPEGLRAIARSFTPAPKLDGVEFTVAPISGSGTLLIDRTQIEILPSVGAEARSPALGEKKAGSFRLYAYVMVGLFGSIGMYAAHGSKKALASEPAMPNLWAAGSGKCPQVDPEQARASATARLSLALSKQERSPFHPEDGVAAVGLYRLAEACFRVADMNAEADSAADDADRLQHGMTDDFRLHRIRLQRALAMQDFTLAERESGILLSFLPPHGVSGEGAGGAEAAAAAAKRDAYATWLSNLRRKLQITYGGKKHQ